MSDQDKSAVSRLAYWIRDRLNGELFAVIDTTDKDVLDVGGGSFFLRLRHRGQRWRSYSVVEPAADLLPAGGDDVKCFVASAEDMPFDSDSFDLVLAVQVLEHVFDPIAALREMHRCVRPGGRIVILVPQSGTLHMVPHHYYNLTRYWLFRMADDLDAEIELWRPMGGAWRTIASRLFLMFWPVLGLNQATDPLLRKRGWSYWVFFPFQFILAVLIFPFAMLMSVRDIKEEANNHLMVLRKRGNPN